MPFFFRLFTYSVLITLLPLLHPPDVNGSDSLKFAVHPYLPATEIIEKFTPLVSFIEEKTGYDIEITISKDYTDHIERAGTGKVDFAYMGPASYVKMEEKYGQPVLLTRLQVKGKPAFQGVIICRQDSGLEKLGDLAGKKFAFGDPDSTMSHLVPRFMLWKEGIDVYDLSAHIFLKNHNNVALGVLVGDYDAGAVKEGVFEKYASRGLRALARTPLISEHLFVAGSSLNPEISESLRQAMFTVDDSENGDLIMSSIKSSVTGFVPVNDSDYDNLRIILTKLRAMKVIP